LFILGGLKLLCLAYHVIAFEETSKACTGAMDAHLKGAPATPDDRSGFGRAKAVPNRESKRLLIGRTQRIKRVGELI
jgi:hypothetical protein